MSTLTVLLKSDRIHILTDSTVIDEKTRRYSCDTEKVRILKKTNIVMIVQGLWIHTEMLQYVFEATTKIYEDALITGRQLKTFFDLIKNNADARPDAWWNLVIAGFGEKGPQAHTMSNKPDPLQGRKPWEWWEAPVPGFLMAPPPRAETLGAILDADNPEPLFPQLLQEQRAKSFEHSSRIEIGGRVTHMLITEGGIAKREIGGWPDELGQPLNPFLKFAPAKPTKAAA